jgi:hypothetical protein
MSWVNIGGHFINLTMVTSFSCLELKDENDVTYLQVTFHLNRGDLCTITLDDYRSREELEARFAEITDCVDF